LHFPGPGKFPKHLGELPLISRGFSVEKSCNPDLSEIEHPQIAIFEGDTFYKTHRPIILSTHSFTFSADKNGFWKIIAFLVKSSLYSGNEFFPVLLQVL